MIQLGAHPIIELGLGDDQHILGVDEVFQPWRRNLWQNIKVITIKKNVLTIIDPF